MKGTAAIIGAGIGGLGAARALMRHGWQVTVLERARTLPATGTVLGMWPAAMRALDDVGVGEAIREQAGRVEGSAAEHAGLRTPQGRTLLTVPRGVDLCLVPRPVLLAALADGVDITFDAPVSDPYRLDNADVIIGADGIFSPTRRAAFGEPARARSLGAVAWRGTVPGTVSAYGETWGPGAMFGMTPTGHDATNWYGCIRADGPFAGPRLPRLREAFGSWPAGVGEVLDRVQEESILHHELFESPALASYVKGNVAVLGDAAHAMGPYLGRGACEALVDGVTLGRSLVASPTIEQGLAAYDRARRVPTQRLVRSSRLMGRFAMMGTGSSIRNAVLGAVGGVLTLWSRRR